jgi:hypothetical protein
MTVSGSFPDALHERLGKMCPVMTRINVKGSDLSAFQRVTMRVGPDDDLGVRSVGHFFPLDKEVMFLCTALQLKRLGFQFTFIGQVFRTPSSKWGAPFADFMERRRRDAKQRNDKDEEDVVKFITNAVLGAIKVDPSKFTSLISEKMYVDVDDVPGDCKQMTKAQRMNDDPAHTLRVLQAGDLRFYEMKKTSWRHTQLTMAFALIHAIAQCDLVDIVHGDGGILEHFPDAIIGYGCTDSLIVELPLSAKHIERGIDDARHALLYAFEGRLDISNIPFTSTFWSRMTSVQRQHFCAYRSNHAGKWGHLKLEDQGAGISHVHVNGVNRWGYTVVRSDTDTPESFKLRPTVLKSVPLAFKDTETYTMEAFARNWYTCPSRLTDDGLPALPPCARMLDGGTVSLHFKDCSRRQLSRWGNRACIVSGTPPFHQYPLGSNHPEAVRLRKGDAV